VFYLDFEFDTYSVAQADNIRDHRIDRTDQKCVGFCADRNAKYGWYRYDSRFALSVYNETGEIERYNVFHASLIVRHSEDKKLYLYDILDIKKETSNPIEP
jgi:hypothetical protein